MTPAEAGKILGISPKADIEQVKKQYRRLMLQVHPDVSGPSKARYQYSAQEINLAYGVLKKRLTESEGLSFSGKGENSRKNNFHWDAPVNDQAWKERDVLHYAEDYEGNILGNFTIARGKYLWTTEEDFPLFLLSIYRCGQELLDEVNASLQRKEDSFLRRKIHPSAYLSPGSAVYGQHCPSKRTGKENSSRRRGKRNLLSACYAGDFRKSCKS